MKAVSLRLGLIVAMLAHSPAGAQEFIAEFTGNGSRVTHPFTAPEGWRLSYWSQAGMNVVLVHATSVDQTEIVNSNRTDHFGQSERLAAGTYYLLVIGEAGWRLRVVP